jgi:gamma-butyrobetaine dioxygenase
MNLQISLLTRQFTKLACKGIRPSILRFVSTVSNQTEDLAHSNDKSGVQVGTSSVEISWPAIRQTDANMPHTSNYSHVWLRDNCPCPLCLHPSNRQKLHSSADIPLNIAPENAIVRDDGIEITWDKPLRHHHDSNTHKSFYPLSFLSKYSSPTSRQTFRYNNMKYITWDRNLMHAQNKFIPYDEYNTEEGLYKTLKQLFDYGIVFLNNVPTEDCKVTEVAERIGNIRESFYGRDFDVKSVAKSTNIAYTSLYLGFHMDLLYVKLSFARLFFFAHPTNHKSCRYFEAPPGLQLLHNLKNTVIGGSSIFVDSFQAVNIMKEKHPEEYRVLCEIPVTFHYVNDGHHMYYRRPTIVNDYNQEGGSWGMHVNYAPPFQGPLDIDDPKEAKRFYKAFQLFADIVEDEKLRFELTLKPGQLGMFPSLSATRFLSFNPLF